VQVAMDQKGDDAWLRMRLHAADWRLHYPRWQLSHAMQMTPGIPWRFRWTWSQNHFAVANGPITGPPVTPVTVPLSIGLGWSFIHPFVSTIDSNRVLWTSLWLGFWFGLLGWLAGALGTRASLLAGAGAVGLYSAVSLGWGMELQVSELAAAVAAYGVLAVVARLGSSRLSS